MDTLPIYYKRGSTILSASQDDDAADRPSSPSRLSFPVSVRSFESSRQSTATVPPVPPRPERWDTGKSDGPTSRTSRASKRGSVMLLNGPNGLMSGKGGAQQDWMREFKPLGEEEEPSEEEARDVGRRDSPSQSPLPPSSLFPHSTIDHAQLPLRSSSRSPVQRQIASDPPALPPRPPKLSTPSPLVTSHPFASSSRDSALSSPSSSCPPTMSPFSTMSSTSTSTTPLMGPPPLPARSKSPRFRHPPSSSSSNSDSTTPTLPTSSSSSSLNFGGSSLTAAFGRGLKQTGLRDKFVAGYGLTKEWGGKGKGKLQEFAQGGAGGGGGGSSQPRSSTSSERPSTLPTSSSSPQLETFPPHSTTSPSIPPATSTSNPVRLPCVIFGVSVPRVSGVAFGTSLSPLVAATHLSSSLPPRPQSLSPITGDACLLYLPAIAYRCLEYLSEWGLKEEGIYRIPGRSNMVQQLRALFDAGLGSQSDCDLRELHPSRLDPNAVASCFKNWLRELPESLLSPQLESKIDQFTQEQLGYPASSSHFLASTSASATTPSSPNQLSATTSPNPESSSGARRVAPISYLEELADIFANEMPAENFFLLRAIAYHLSLLASHSATNKMTLTNLRLILSPTLRLSPGFLLVLVEEREIIFGGVNQDAKARQGATSHLVTPPLLSTPAFATQAISAPRASSARSPSPQPPSATSEPQSQTTPIADKFTFPHSAIPLAPPHPSAVGQAPTTTNQYPSAGANQPKLVPPRRIDETEGFFSSRSHHRPAGNTATSAAARMHAGEARERSLGMENEQSESDEALEWRERERIKSADLKLSLPEGFEDSFGLGLGLSEVEFADGRRASQNRGTDMGRR